MSKHSQPRASTPKHPPHGDVTVRFAVIFLILMVRFFFIPMSPYNVFRIMFVIFLLLVDPARTNAKGIVDGRIFYALSIFFLTEPFHEGRQSDRNQ